MATPIVLLGDTLHLGGTEGQFVEIACGLDRRRWDARVVCLRPHGALADRLRAAAISTSAVGCGSLKRPRAAAAIVRLGRRLRRDGVRLVHAFDFYSNVVGVLAARLARVPVIASQRDLGDVRPPARRRIQRLALRAADHVSVNSPAIAARVAADGIRADRLTVVANGVDTRRFSPRPRVAAAVPVIGAVGNLRPEKGVEDLVRAAALLRDSGVPVRLEIWGDGVLRGAIARLVAASDLGAGVALCGATREPDAALARFDVFALPSLSEGCSNVLLEAMAMGLAVVATNVGGTPYIAQDETTAILVPPADPTALAKALQRLVENPALAAQLGAAGRRRVDTEFALGPMLARVEGLYASVLTRAEARR